jgi:hypothetical protein
MMADNENKGLDRSGRTKFVAMLLCVGLGAALMAGGFVYGADKNGDAATMAGVIAGVGAGMFLVGAIVGWLYRPGGPRWTVDPTEPGTRDRLQAQRARQLAIFPWVSLIFLGQAFGAVEHVLSGEVRWVDGIRLVVPVLYAWVTALIVMGWDRGSLKNKRLLEDELTQSLRARSLTLAFFVLLGGATLALGLGLWRAEVGIVSLILALAAGGAAAGLRFAWLFREAGRDDG